MLDIFVINLDRRTDRLAAMAQRLQAAGLVWQRVSAIDGRTTELGHLVDWRKHRCYTQFLPPLWGAIGCYFSHRSIWERMLTENIPRALILEDDVAPLPEWNPAILDMDIGALGLDNLRLDSSRIMGPMPKARYFEIPIAGWTAKNMNSWGAGAYLLTREGAEKCLRLPKMWIMADDFFMMNRVLGLRTALLYPQMWGHPEETASDVTPSEAFYGQVANFTKKLSFAGTALIREVERMRYLTLPRLFGTSIQQRGLPIQSNGRQPDPTRR